MRPCARPTLTVRGAEFGAAKPLLCVPLVARDLAGLLDQARAVHTLAADVVEWRADSFEDLSRESVQAAARELRTILSVEPIIFTLRAREEGGAAPIPADARSAVILDAVGTGLVDLIDVELFNGPSFIGPLLEASRPGGVRVILSFHDFQRTPEDDVLQATVGEMARLGADIAKVACMPQDPGDVLRLLHATYRARLAFPSLPLITMSMGRLGLASRVAGFLFGSDMSFAVGRQASAPGQIPIAELRSMIDGLLRHA
jgi:3-dehydroquinate dehydratase I